jgi:hypothetical protein
MLVAVLAGFVGLVTVLVALQLDRPLDPEPIQPDWDVLPDPSDLARVSFPVSVSGYDPATVEVTFEALAAAYADLLAVADARTIERARRRAALRLGVAPEDAVSAMGSIPELKPPYRISGTAEELRAAAALAALEVETETGDGADR